MEEAPRMGSKIKHLEFIQGVINRLASDSFRMKGWCVVLVAALFILLAREGRIEFVVALIPVIVFWASTATSCGRSTCSAPSTITGYYELHSPPVCQAVRERYKAE